MKQLVLFVAVIVFGVAANADDHRTASEPGTELYFISPMHGATIKGPVSVKFGLRGMGVAPAGVEQEATGHHHLIIDVPLPSFDESIPLDENHMHFGGGQTETTIELAPGTHTLQLLLGDHYHIPHDPPVMSKQITITVVE